MTGRSQRMLHGTTKVKHTLKLTYENRPLEELDYFIEHFNAQRGTHATFKLSESAMFAGWKNKSGDKALLGFNQGWRYASAPRIRSRRGKLGSIEVDLVTTSYGDNAYTTSCEPCPPDSPPGSPPPPAPPKPPNGPDFPPDPGNGPPGGGSGGGSGGGAEGPQGNKPLPSPGPGVPIDPGPQPTPTPVPEPVPGTYPLGPPGATGCETRDLSVGSDWVYWSFEVTIKESGYTRRRCDSDRPNMFRDPRTIGVYTYDCPFATNKAQLLIDEAPFMYVCGECDEYTAYITRFRIWACGGINGDPTPDWNAWFWQPNFKAGIGCFPEGQGYIGQQSYYQEWVKGFDLKIWKRWKNPDGTFTPKVPVDLPVPEPGSTNPLSARSAPPLLLPEPRATTENNNFPNISPSRRRITQGDYTINRFGGDQEITLPLPSTAVKNDLVMELVFANREDEIARTFLDHYDRSAGALWDFKIAPVNSKQGTFAGWTDKESKNIREGRWIYTRPPRVETTHPGYSTTTIQLINLLPETVAPGSGSSGKGPEVPPTPTPGPGKPLPAPKPTVPANWPDDFDPNAWPDDIPRDAPDIPEFEPPSDPNDWPGYPEAEAQIPSGQNWYFYFRVTVFESGYRNAVEPDGDPWYRNTKWQLIRDPLTIQPTFYASYDVSNIKIKLYSDRCAASNYMKLTAYQTPEPPGVIPQNGRSYYCETRYTDDPFYFCNRATLNTTFYGRPNLSYLEACTTPDDDGYATWGYNTSYNVGQNLRLEQDITGVVSSWRTIVKVEVIYMDYSNNTVGRGTFFDNTSKFQ